MIIIGSQAAVANGLKYNRKIDFKETDVIMSPKEFALWLFNLPEYGEVNESPKFPGKYLATFKNGDRWEIDATGNHSNELLATKINDEFLEWTVAPKWALALIKRSHLPFPIHPEKTFQDFLEMRKQWYPFDSDFESIMLDHKDFYTTRFNEAKERYGYLQERIKLNKSNDDFFKGGAKFREYVHDDLHAAVAHTPNKPMYERCKTDLSSAFIDMNLFYQLPFEDQIRMVQEEAMVLTLERFLIPLGDNIETLSERQIKIAFIKSLCKFSTSMCKGKFQSFIFDNILHLTEPRWKFVDMFITACNNAQIRSI